MRRSPVVWPVVTSSGTRSALAQAVALARFLESTLHLLYIPHGSGKRAGAPGKAIVHPVIADVIYSAVRDLLPATGRRVDSRIVARRGTAKDAVATYARSIHAGLIVVDSDYGAGALARSLGKSAPCPVLVVPDWEAAAAIAPVPFREVVCAIEAVHRARPAVRAALELTRGSGGRLTLLHVAPVLPLRKQKDQVVVTSRSLRRLVPSRASGTRLRPLIVSGLPYRRILRAASEADGDLIVMAKPPRTGLDEALLGSTTRAVLRRARVPVLLVPVSATPSAAKRRHHSRQKGGGRTAARRPRSRT